DRKSTRLNSSHSQTSYAVFCLTKKHDAVTFADAEHGGVDVGGTRLQGGVRIGDGAPGVVVGMEFDVAVDRLPHHRHQLEDLVRGRDPDRVGKADPLRV